jgi:hypothetical protein
MSITLSELVIPVTMSSVAGVAGVLGAVGAVGTMIQQTTQATLEHADSLDTLGDKFGMTADQASGYDAMLKQAGIDQGTFEKALVSSQKNLVDAEGNLLKAGQAYEALGVSVYDSNGNLKTQAQLFDEVAPKIAAIQDPTEKARVVTELYGKAGIELNDAFELTSSVGLQGYIDKAKEQGTAMSGEQIDNAVNLSRVMNDLKAVFGGIAIQIGNALIPILNQLMPIFVNTFNQPVVKEAISAVATALGSLLTAILPIIPALLPLITSVLPIVVQLFTSVISAILPLIVQILPPLISLVVTVITAFLPLINTILPPIITLFSGVISAILPMIVKILPPLITLLAQLITGFMPLITAVLPIVITLFQGVITVVTNIITAILPVFTYHVNNITRVLGLLMPVIKDVASWISGALQSAFNGISSAISGVVGWVQSFIDKLSSITLPDWLTPGSPTPFEMGLRGINDAMSELNNNALTDFNANLNVNKPNQPNTSTSQSYNGDIFDYDKLASTLSRTLRTELQRL